MAYFVLTSFQIWELMFEDGSYGICGSLGSYVCRAIMIEMIFESELWIGAQILCFVRFD